MEALDLKQLRELERCYLHVQSDVWARLQAVQGRIKHLRRHEPAEPKPEAEMKYRWIRIKTK